MFGVRHDILVGQRGTGLSLPGHGAAFQQFGEQIGLLFEEFFIVAEVVAEQWKRVDARSAPEDDLGAAAGDGIESRIALEHPHRIVGAENRNGRPKPDLLGACRDRPEHHIGGRERKVIGVMLPDAEVVDSHRVGEDPLFHDVADGLCVRERVTFGVGCHIAEGVETQNEREGGWGIH